MLQGVDQVFWDVDLENFDPMKFPRFTVERVLEYGNAGQVRWLEKNFKKNVIYSLGKKSRILSFKTKAFLEVRYGN